MFLASKLTNNDSPTILAIQSYNDTVGSSTFVDNAAGTNKHLTLKAIGPVTHDNTVNSTFCQSNTSIYFATYDGHIEGTDMGNYLNIYGSDFSISLHYYLLERVHDIVLLGMWVDSNNFWYLRLTKTGCNPTFVYHVGNDLVNISLGGYCDTKKWLFVQLNKIGRRFTIMHGKSGTTTCVQTSNSFTDYLPPLELARAKLVIGGWLKSNGSHNSGLAIKGAMNSILIKKAAMNNICLEQGKYKF